jgi:hypothetical protein
MVEGMGWERDGEGGAPQPCCAVLTRLHGWHETVDSPHQQKCCVQAQQVTDVGLQCGVSMPYRAWANPPVWPTGSSGGRPWGSGVQVSMYEVPRNVAAVHNVVAIAAVMSAMFRHISCYISESSRRTELLPSTHCGCRCVQGAGEGVCCPCKHPHCPALLPVAWWVHAVEGAPVVCSQIGPVELMVARAVCDWTHCYQLLISH